MALKWESIGAGNDIARVPPGDWRSPFYSISREGGSLILRLTEPVLRRRRRYLREYIATALGEFQSFSSAEAVAEAHFAKHFPLQALGSIAEENPDWSYLRWRRVDQLELHSIAGPVRVYAADVPGKGSYKLILRPTRGSKKQQATHTTVQLVHWGDNDFSRLGAWLNTVLPVPFDEKGASLQAVRAAKKWAYHQIFSDLEMLALEGKAKPLSDLEMLGEVAEENPRTALRWKYDASKMQWVAEHAGLRWFLERRDGGDPRYPREYLYQTTLGGLYLDRVAKRDVRPALTASARKRRNIRSKEWAEGFILSDLEKLARSMKKNPQAPWVPIHKDRCHLMKDGVSYHVFRRGTLWAVSMYGPAQARRVLGPFRTKREAMNEAEAHAYGDLWVLAKEGNL